MTAHHAGRPDPEALLRSVEEQETAARRGRLKVFLGYAPRVGKSRSMFEEGVRRKMRGQDVVVGAIQPKGAEELAPLIAKLEVVGTGALDVAAILQRKPQICLVDQLALSNPPGSKHPKRWQDVEELLENGITVVTALNLQYVAEQQDAVERITGKRAGESVPVSFIRGADEIVVVDAPPEDLAPAGAERNQLCELRELALLLAADVVEHQLQRYMDAHGITHAWGTQERILVCITPLSNTKAMIESGRRNADRFHGQLFAVYVKQECLTREAEEMLEANLELARKLGAEVHVLEGNDVIARILEFAHAHRVTQIFIGHTQESRWRFWSRTAVERLIAAAEGIDVRIFPQSRRAA